MIEKCAENIKLSDRTNINGIIFQIFLFKKIMEEKLVSVTGREFQIVVVFHFGVENCFILCVFISSGCGS